MYPVWQLCLFNMGSNWVVPVCVNVPRLLSVKRGVGVQQI